VSINLSIASWRIRLSICALLTFVGCSVNAQTLPRNLPKISAFNWKVQQLTASPLIFGVTTRQEAFSKLFGPTALIEGDGGDPAQFCYLQKSPSHSSVRIVLSFFGSGTTGILSAVEWTALKSPADSWVRSICHAPRINVLPLGLIDGPKLGDSRRATRRALGPPSRTKVSGDTYDAVSKTTGGMMSTLIQIEFGPDDRVISLLVHQLETN
jgi:hypothetical protein